MQLRANLCGRHYKCGVASSHALKVPLNMGWMPSYTTQSCCAALLSSPAADQR